MPPRMLAPNTFADEVEVARRKAELRKVSIRVTIKHKGQSGFDVKPPEVEGYRPYWIARIGGSHTTWTYVPVDA